MNLQFSNNFSLELLEEDGFFKGIGSVTCGDVALRNGRRPWWVEVRTPQGDEVCGWRMESQIECDGGFDLEFTPLIKRSSGAPMEWLLHEIRPRLGTGDWSAAPFRDEDSRLTLELREAERGFGATNFQGFSVRFRWESQQFPIYKILERGTWEPQQSAIGCEFWMRSGTAQAIQKFTSSEEFYSTEWYLPGARNPSVFQFFPLQSSLQGFTFTACEVGTLVTWPTEVTHLRVLYEKKRSLNEIEHWNEHGGDLSNDFATSPIEILWADTPKTSRVARFNLWENVREYIWHDLHQQIGMRVERVVPWSQIEEWGNADLTAYREKGVPKLVAAGAQNIELSNQFANNMNTFGASNMCCTVDWSFSEKTGAEPMRALCNAAKNGGARVSMWGNTALSTLAYIGDLGRGHDATSNGTRNKRFVPLPREGSTLEALSHTSQAFVTNPAGHIEADHYAPVFCQVNLRDETVRSVWLEAWKKAHDEAGISGIFIDSSFNMSSDKWHWQAEIGGDGGGTIDQLHLLGHFRPDREPVAAISSQYRAYLDLIVEMQSLGYCITGEDIGVWGLSRSGPAISKRLESLPLWSETILNFDAPAIREAGADPDEIFFRALAYRNMLTIHWDTERDCLSFRPNQELRGDFDIPNEWQLKVWKAFGKACHTMWSREIIEGSEGREMGVVYRDGAVRVLWAFEDFDYRLSDDASTKIHQLVNEESECHQKHLKARRFGVYFWDEETTC